VLVFLNGKFVPEEKAVISVFDRGFLYGDGLFEALLVRRGQPLFWQEHIQRFQQGIEALKLQIPYSYEELLDFAGKLIKRNGMPHAILRLAISRGVGAPGYSPKNARHPTIVMSLRPAPPTSRTPRRWSVIISSWRLPANDPLALFKTANKLHHVLARGEADDDGADDAILLNTDGHLVEGTSSNIFWVKNNIVQTPTLPAGPLPGVTRGVILDLCRKLKIRVRETVALPRALVKADGVFLTMTSQGIVEVKSVNGTKLARSPLARKLQAEYLAVFDREPSTAEPAS
jgi:branched-chain amino acid aminotransferase